MISESDMRREVVKLIESDGGHASSVESHATSAGIPDLDFCWDGLEGHIELKFWTVKNNKGLRPSQVRWFRDRIKAGGKPCLLVKTMANIFILVPGTRYRDLQGKVSSLMQAEIEQNSKHRWTQFPTAVELKNALDDLIKGSQN
jgi:hypothetical protein